MTMVSRLRCRAEGPLRLEQKKQRLRIGWDEGPEYVEREKLDAAGELGPQPS